MKLFLLSSALLALFQFCNADQIEYLAYSRLGTQDVPYKTCYFNKTSVYVSASNDDPTFLNQIFIKDGNGVVKTALELKNSRVLKNKDLKNGWFTKGPLSLYTALDDMNVYDMTGIIYCRALLPSKSNNVLVYDITQPNTITLQETSSYNQTVILMNTLSGSPTLVYNWNQKSTHLAAFGLRFPNDVEVGRWEIFRNPLSIDKISDSYFMKNVEPFSMNANIFYGVFNGGVQFSVKPGSVDTKNYVASKSSTTGLITKTDADKNFNNKVTFVKNPNGSTVGVSGFNALGSIYNSTITFDLVSSGIHHPTTIKTMDSYTSSSVKQLSDYLEIDPGYSFYYYVQYFNIEDATLVQ